MASNHGPTELARGKTTFGADWAVGFDGTRLIVLNDGYALIVDGAEREKFAEAVARAVTPGQAGPSRESRNIARLFSGLDDRVAMVREAMAAGAGNDTDAATAAGGGTDRDA